MSENHFYNIRKPSDFWEPFVKNCICEFLPYSITYIIKLSVYEYISHIHPVRYYTLFIEVLRWLVSGFRLVKKDKSLEEVTTKENSYPYWTDTMSLNGFLIWWWWTSIPCGPRSETPYNELPLLIDSTGFPGGSDSKESACNAGDPGAIPGLGRPPGEGNNYPLEYSCLENSMKRGDWWATVHRVSSVQLLSRVQLFETPWTAARQASLSTTNSRSLLILMSIELVMPSSHLILCRPLFLLPQSLPASESFPVSQLFPWGGQSIGVSASASVLPMNTQDWSSLEWTGWISLQSKGFSRVFSNTTVQKHQFFSAQPSSQSNSHIYAWSQEKP